MIEINRRLYMDEITGEKTEGLTRTRAVVQSVLAGLIDEHYAGRVDI